MSNPQQDVQDWIRTTVAGNDVVLFMKGNKNMPQCGFSAQVDHILRGLGVDFKDVNVLQDMAIRDGIKAYLELADRAAALRQGRVRRRLRHRPRDAGSGRADGDVRRKGRRLRQVEAAGLVQLTLIAFA